MEKNIKDNRELFYLKYYDLFEDGTLREIYTGEKISVYAVAEKNYGVVPYLQKVNAERLAAGTWTITPEIDAEVLGNKGSRAQGYWHTGNPRKYH